MNTAQSQSCFLHFRIEVKITLQFSKLNKTNIALRVKLMS